MIPGAEPGANPLLRAIGLLGAGLEWCFGVVVLLLGLSVLAAVPLGQFLVLGYLLEASGRVARSGRIRDGFIGVRRAALFGGAALVGGVMWLPLYLMSLQAEAARIIDPRGTIARVWEITLGVSAVVLVLHVAGALFWGGRVRHFLNPINVPWLAHRLFQGGMYQEARDRVWELVVGLRLPYYFWLGLRGFVGGFIWLACPLFLLGLGHKFWGVGLLGAALLSVVVPCVPFLQVRFARTRRFATFFELRKVRGVYRRAPLAFAFALCVHLLFAMPLYVLKIELIPRELFFVEGLFFLLFIFPARLLGGWAYARGTRRQLPRLWVSRWAGRLAAVPVVLAYVFAVWVSQHIGWAGVSSLYEQHAFLLPVPFVTWR
ncbi:hypothetical protein GobsT_31810 [Gemmata obscuriglobus]|uniref:DUF4013 domain-containing protein n=1 Tax=Gemmata obscuriglobus TaxID=114 RepID=A0A2Z3GYW7_9BACT|nr:hypothetical protein [Gemmata obscuriglobus]AWM38638.1 hypothetical protein C1280_17700 [Gemmata obscuriglobus]QEG28403.1 hypothetical protein GobsT_31810 [Gemmata obscuriglobus]VTS06343.1 Putative uncharacterized protein OS=uncultured Acidobacteria bacterium A2 PE=4 SV=1 [Gemmata obscuriglobus UQM 2246]